MKKLKLNAVVLDTMSNDQLKEVYGGLVRAADTDNSVVVTDTACKLCTVVITPKKDLSSDLY
jgi:hypothetical protein